MEYDKILTDILGRKDFLVVGKNVIRTDALDKALGKAKYTADYVPKDTTILKVYRSTVAHARIKSIDTSEALKIPGVEAIYTGADVTGNNQIGYALPDQPFLNDKKVHFVGDPIALICAKDEYAAAEAMEKVFVDYEILDAHLDIDAALVEGAEHVHDGGNVAVVTKIRKGDIDGVFENADAIVEDTYWSPFQDHMYIETEACYAIPGESKVTVIGNGQSPFLCREKVAHVLGWDLNQVQIIQCLTGGAFGGKDDQGPLLMAYAAFASLKLGKPVVHIWNREESLKFSNKRFPARIHYKSACTKDGKVTGIEVKITLECGAYANRSPFWLWRQTAHAAGPYEIDNCFIDGQAVYTNKVYGGSYRGFGDLALHFACEQQMDKLAHAIGMDPIEFRLKNVLTEGAKTACDQLLDSSVGVKECLEAVRDASDWANNREPVWDGTKVRGYGVGLAYHGISTSRSTPDWSAASLMMNQDGSCNYRTGIVEIGQGSPFGHVKIVSEIIGVPPEKIRIDLPDTDSTLNAKPTHGSRGLMVGGTAAAKAALMLRESMVNCAAELFEVEADRIDLRDNKAFDKKDKKKVIAIKELAEEMYLRGYDPGAHGYFKAPKRFFDPETGLGVNYSVYTFAATVAEVEVDTETGETSVVKIWPAMDCGRAIDPMMIEGQIEGAISQGMGFALMENMELNDKGEVINPNFTDYIVPSSLDTPEIEPCIIVEKPYKHGAFGAKGVGEPAIISIVPTITNAIYHATGQRFSTIPIRPWTMHKALKEARK